jgi:cysteine synthase B
VQILDLVGNTPLLEIKTLIEPDGARVFAKAEFLNPSGSVKDRAAKAMILDGIERGKLTYGKEIIDATSGNTGISYAMFGAAFGFGVKIFLPSNASIERKKTMEHFGAQIVQTDPLEGSDGAFLLAQAEAQRYPERYFYPNQYHNEANPLAHYRGTGEEILRQSEGKVTHFVCAMGTSGTFIGVARRLKESNADIQTISVQPNSPFHGIEGTKHLQSTLRSGFFDENLVDSYTEVSTEQAYQTTKALALKEGIYVGVSSGANVYAASRLAATLPKSAIVVTILADNGNRYASESFWSAA